MPIILLTKQPCKEQGQLPCLWLWQRVRCTKHVCLILAEGDAAAGADNDDPRPRRWNHAVVVLIAVMLVGGVLGYGIADGCMCGPTTLQLAYALPTKISLAGRPGACLGSWATAADTVLASSLSFCHQTVCL